MQTRPLDKLIAWIAANTSQTAFAEACNCSDSHMSNVLSGKKRPSLELVEAFVRETRGAITANDVLSDDARRMIRRHEMAVVQ